MNPIQLPSTVMTVRDLNQKLTVRELAEALYEGTPHLSNLAEKLARQHGQAGALAYFNMMGEEVQNFWMNIAQQLIDHAKEWEPNQNSACVLSEKERERLSQLPSHPELVENRRNYDTKAAIQPKKRNDGPFFTKRFKK